MNQAPEPRVSRRRGERRVIKSAKVPDADDNNQPLSLELEDPAETPPPKYSRSSHGAGSDTGSIASRSPKSVVSAAASSIYDYLDALETESAMQFEGVQPPSSFGSRNLTAWDEDVESGGTKLSSPAGSLQSDQSNAYYVEIKAKLGTMAIELNDKTKTIELLKGARKKDKAKTKQLLAAADAAHKDQLKQLQLKFEKELEQHLDFAQGLVADKAALAKRCDELVAELQKANATAAREAERAKMQLKDARERWLLQEKSRREQWIAKKTEEIKKSTVSALEPDIQLILARGKADLERAQEAAGEERRKLKLLLEKEKEAALQRQKDDYERQLVDAREKERVKLVARLDAADAELQQQLSAQRRRLQDEAEVVRNELLSEVRALKASHQHELEDAKVQSMQRLTVANEQAKKERQELLAKCERDVQAAREQARADQGRFEQELEARLRQEMEHSKQALEAQMLQSRDAKIELVIDKLQEESRQRLEAAEQRAQRKLEQERKDWERKLKQTSEVEGVWMDKNRELHAKLGRLEASLASLREEKDVVTNDSKLASDKASELARLLTDERRSHDSAIAQLEKRCRAIENDGAMVKQQLTAEATSLRDKLEQLEAHWQAQLRQRQQEHEAALGSLHERVRATVARKDQVIAGLQEDVAVLGAKLDKSRALIEEQRRQLFSE